jgi:hypothetical protein
MASYINIWLLVVFYTSSLLLLIPTESAASDFPKQFIRTSTISSSHHFLPIHRIPLIPSPPILLPFQNQTFVGSHVTIASPNMSLLAAQHFTPQPITVSLDSDPRLHLLDWTRSVHTCARAMLPALDVYGALSLVCTDAAWAQLTRNQITNQAGALVVRARPNYPIPTPPLAADTPAVRQLWKFENQTMTLQQ